MTHESVGERLQDVLRLATQYRRERNEAQAEVERLQALLSDAAYHSQCHHPTDRPLKRFMLYLQQPKAKEIGLGDFSLERDTAHFFADIDQPHGRVLAQLERPICIHASSQGLMFSGFEQVGVDKTGHAKYHYQEWWLMFAGEEAKEKG